MLDKFNRNINYLRISVTDRCNQRCTYCIGKEKPKFTKLDSILSFEEIYDFTKIAVKFGITKVRITGGEPLVRKDNAKLVKMLSGIKEIKDLSMTTNGMLLGKYAATLKKAGLQRINVSLDSINSETYKKITGSNLNTVLNSLAKAKKIRFSTIKINCVIQESPEEIDAKEVAGYCIKNGFQIRYIRAMDISKGKFWPIFGGEGGKCKRCNRLRFSCDGKIFPCLFSNSSFSIKELGYEEAIRQAIEFKPKSGDKASTRFHEIGG